MNLLPFENITYQSRCSPREIQAKLAAVVEPKKYFRKKDGLSDKNLRPYD